MLFVLSALRGCAVKASDGWVGAAKDVLFDDKTWRVRWMVVDTGTWLPGRKVLIHPSAIAPLDPGPPSGNWLGLSMGRELVASVRLTKAQIEASPDVRDDEPVSQQMERDMYEHYGWDPYWSSTDPRFGFGVSGMAVGWSPPPDRTEPAARERAHAETPPASGDPHLRSVSEVNGYHVHATDGDIGHIEHLMADDDKWEIRYLIVATRNWWPGKRVLLTPYAVRSVDWLDRHIHLNVTRDQVKSSPPWDPATVIDQISEQRLHKHYGWPGYGW
jgi:hypothetical protein